MARTLSLLVAGLLVLTSSAVLGQDATKTEPAAEPGKAAPDAGQAAEPEKAPEPPVPASKLFDAPPLLEAVDWITPPVDLDRLYGQTVIIAFVETWCSICNGWAPDYCRQLKVASEGKPVTIIYLGVDLSAAGFKQYMKSRGLVGHAAGLVSKTVLREFGISKTLWQSVVINPQGQKVFEGQFGTYYPRGEKKIHVITNDLPSYCGDATAIVPIGAGSKLEKVDLAIRVGQLGAALKALARMGDDGKETRDKLLAHGEKLYNVAWSYEKSEPYLAYRMATVVAEEYKGEPIAEKATTLGKRLEQDKLVQLGKAADKKLSQLNAKARRQPNPNQIDAAFKYLTEQCRDSRAGRVAMTALSTQIEDED